MSNNTTPKIDQWQYRSEGLKCARCMWYLDKIKLFADSNGDVLTTIGRCRRNAPVVELGWPVVTDRDWCGNFKLDETKI